MVNLNDYLKLNSNAIVDLVNKKYVPAEMAKEPTFEALAEILQGIFIFRYGSEIGTRDQARSCNGHNLFNVVRMAFPNKNK